MYLDHFGLDSAPFNITSQTDFFYDGAARGATLDALLYAVEQGEGIVKVTGEVGSGKTMLCRMLLESLPDNVETIFLSVPSLKRDEIVQALSIELGLDIQGQTPYQLLTALQKKLIGLYADDRRVLALIDEAHAMPIESLEEIRLLSNLENSDHKLLQIILFGQPELNDHLQLPHMRQLKERITHSFQLHPLKKTEIGPYLAHRMESAGYGGPPLFSDRCIKLMAHASEGLTRRVNIIADKSLLAAYSDNANTVTTQHVQAAIRDSDFPMPAEWGKRVAVGAATLAVAGAIAFSLSKASWFSPNPAPVAVVSNTNEVAHTTPLKFNETPSAAELVVGSPQWHERNINKINKLSKYVGNAIPGSSAQAASTKIEQNDVKESNVPDNLSKSSNSGNSAAKPQSKTGFDMDTEISLALTPSSALPGTPISKSEASKNSATPANPAQNKPTNAEIEKSTVTSNAKTIADLKVTSINLANKNGVAKETLPPSSATVPASPPGSLRENITASKAWLESAPAAQCFIQLLMADINNYSNVEYFLGMAEREVGAKAIHVFPGEIGGQGKYIVVYGETGMNCQAALEKLPTPLKQSKPYIRNVGLLRNEIKFPG